MSTKKPRYTITLYDELLKKLMAFVFKIDILVERKQH